MVGSGRTGLRCVGTSVLRIEKSKGNPGGGSRRNRLMAGCWLQHTNVRSFFPSFLCFYGIIPSFPFSNLCRVSSISTYRGVASQLPTPPVLSAWSVRHFSPEFFSCCVTYAETRQTEISGDWRRRTKSLPFLFLSLPRSCSYHEVSPRRLLCGRPRGWRSRRRRRARSMDGWMVGVAPPRASLPPSPALPPSL